MQEPIEGGEQLLKGAIQFFAQRFSFEAPVSGSHFSLHQTQKPGVAAQLLVGGVFHFIILGFLRFGTFGPLFLTLFSWAHSRPFDVDQSQILNDDGVRLGSLPYKKRLGTPPDLMSGREIACPIRDRNCTKVSDVSALTTEATLFCHTVTF
jgi:hypothetical protein